MPPITMMIATITEAAPLETPRTTASSFAFQGISLVSRTGCLGTRRFIITPSGKHEAFLPAPSLAACSEEIIFVELHPKLFCGA